MSKLKPKAGAVVLAAGRGKRMGSDINKIYLDLKGKPVIYYSLLKFHDHKLIEDIVVVINEEDRKIFYELDEKFNFPPAKVVEGGERRQDSSFAGVSVIKSDLVFVHDAARPNFNPDILDKLMEVAVENGASIPGIKPVDTIRKLGKGKAGEVLSRDRLIKCQTPQCFKSKPLLKALRESIEKGNYYTDDAGVFYASTGIRPEIVDGDEENIKLTKPRDLSLLENYLD